MKNNNKIYLKKGLLKDQIFLAMIQINFKLDVTDEPPHYFYKDLNNYYNKLDFILNSISTLKYKPNIIVFPEYSIPKDYISKIQEFSKKESIIIFAGSYHDESTLENTSPIVIPHMDVYYYKKQFLSDEEIYTKASDMEVPKFIWKYDDHEFSIQIFLCCDYLQTAIRPDRLCIDWLRPGVIIVPMSTDNIVDFYNLANIHLLDQKGKFIVLCNSCGKISYHLKTVGQSAIFGSYKYAIPYRPVNKGDVPYTSNLDDFEGILLCNLNLKSPKIVETKRKSFTRQTITPPARIIEKQILSSSTKHITQYYWVHS